MLLGENSDFSPLRCKCGVWKFQWIENIGGGYAYKVIKDQESSKMPAKPEDHPEDNHDKD